MPNHCSVTVCGHLGRDPETRSTKDGQTVCNASIAYTPYGDGKETVWFTLTVWGKQAERFAQWFKKGDAVLASGELDHDTWTGKDGEKRSRLAIKVSSFSGVGGKKDAEAKPASGGKAKKREHEPAGDDYGDVPF